MANTNSEHQPGVYVKGDSVRIADNAGEAVALVFDGYKRQGAQPAEDGSQDYRELQRMAKEAGIPANQSAEDLQAALAEHEANAGA